MSNKGPMTATPSPNPAVSCESFLDSIESYTTIFPSTISPNPNPSIATNQAIVTANPTSTTPTTPSLTTSKPFSPIDFLNSHFPSESTLVSTLPTLLTTISSRINNLDDKISNSIQHQSEISTFSASEIVKAKTSIGNLSQRISLVQSKARASERAVLEITKDMKRLDYAKRHLQSTITALKRLHMLMNAVEQLKISCQEGKWKECANLLDALRLLLKHFETYQSIDKIKDLNQEVDKIKLNLKNLIFAGIKNKNKLTNQDKHIAAETDTSTNDDTDSDATKSANLLSSSESLADACLVIDALGLNIRENLLEIFCSDILSKYNTSFSPKANTPSQFQSKPSFKIVKDTDNSAQSNDNNYCLDQVERRFTWFRQILRQIDLTFQSVFPPNWHVQYQLTIRFLHLTQEHYHQLLSGPNKDRDSSNVTVLLKALQKSILFEKEMTAWLMREYNTVFSDVNNSESEMKHPTGDDQTLEFDEDGNAVAANSAQGIKMKYVRQIKDKKKNTSKKVATTLHHSNHSQDEEDKPLKPLLCMASGAFDNFMGPYINLERENMDEELTNAASDNTTDTRGELPVFVSSTKLFIYIKNSITRCTVLSTGHTFFNLHQSVQDTLQKYSAVLSNKFPQASISSATVLLGLGATALTSTGAQTNSVYRIPPGEEISVCHVISTCEYCADTVEALEELIKDKIDPDYKSKIDMTGEQETFLDVTAKGLRVLVSGLEMRIELQFREISSINWSTFDSVGEESSYVRSTHQVIIPYVQQLQSLLPPSYFRNFCDKFASAFTTTYYNTLLRLKKISTHGTQQLLLDVYNLKTLLLKLPVISTSNNNSPTKSTAIPPAIYTKMVTKKFSQIEIFLKLVGTPTDQLTEIFKSYWPNGTASDFQQVMTLKGMSRKEQTFFLEAAGLDLSEKNVVTENLALLSERGGDLANKVNTDLNSMRQKVDDFRKAFR